MTYFLKDAFSITVLVGDVKDDNEAIIIYSNLKHLGGLKKELLVLHETSAWARFVDTTGEWEAVSYKDILESLSLPAIVDAKLDRALEHIEELESMLDTAQEAQRNNEGAFARKLQDMLESFDSDELYREAHDGLDLDYQPFDNEA